MQIKSNSILSRTRMNMQGGGGGGGGVFMCDPSVEAK